MQRSLLYTAIKNKAKESLPWVNYIDLQKGQFRRQENHYPIPLPALLIEFGNVTYANTLQGKQTGEVSINIELYLPCVTDSFDDAELETETIQLLDRWDELYHVLHALNIEQITKLTRTRELTAEYGNGYVCLRSEFVASIVDKQPSQTIKIQRPNIQIEPINV